MLAMPQEQGPMGQNCCHVWSWEMCAVWMQRMQARAEDTRMAEHEETGMSQAGRLLTLANYSCLQPKQYSHSHHDLLLQPHLASQSDRYAVFYTDTHPDADTLTQCIQHAHWQCH